MQMKLEIRSLVNLLMWIVFSAGLVAQAQQPAWKQSKPASLELTYDFVHTNGPPNQCGCIDLNGAGLAYVQPLPNSNVSLVASVGGTHAGGIGALNYDLTLYTYTVGARYLPKLPKLKHSLFQPYGEIQVGGIRASGSLANSPSLAGPTIGSSFAATGGGGINLDLHGRVSLKVIDAEYLATNYANGSSDHQNDLRISAGLILILRNPGK